MFEAPRLQAEASHIVQGLARSSSVARRTAEEAISSASKVRTSFCQKKIDNKQLLTI